MSTPTNFNQPTTPNYGNNEDNNQKRLTTIMGVAIAALLGLCVFLLVSKYNTSKQLDTTTMELTQQKEAMNELETKYNDAVTQPSSKKASMLNLMPRSTNNCSNWKPAKTKSPA
ncbi:MAG: hypothetical protein IPK76_12050 [Lewinellaceae bacterium]|nr:hypothetical protein [Lewinellaceae bacterium]